MEYLRSDSSYDGLLCHLCVSFDTYMTSSFGFIGPECSILADLAAVSLSFKSLEQCGADTYSKQLVKSDFISAFELEKKWLKMANVGV